MNDKNTGKKVSDASTTSDEAESGPTSAPELKIESREEALSEAKKRQLEKDFAVDRDDDTEHDTSNSDDDEDVDSQNEEQTEQAGSDEESDDNLLSEASDSNDEPAEESASDSNIEPKKPGRIKRFFRGYWRHKKWTLLLTLLVILGIIAAVPWSRYLILGHYVEKPYVVELIDVKTEKPVSGATLKIENSKAVTDANGKATLHAKVGKRSLEIDKKYYQTYTQSIFVGLAAQKSPDQLKLVATGRQVPVVVMNMLTGKPLANASLKVAGTEVKTDKEGKAVVVLPADKPTLNGTLASTGFIESKVVVQVTETAVKENTFTLVPSGKLYFLSRLSGQIDVIKTNLDGSDRQTVVAGTGKEDEKGTVLLAARDWKYLALQSKRDSGAPKLYLIDTETDKMTVMDEGEAAFTLVGWNNHQFAYQVVRNNLKEWQPNHQAVKVYDAEKKQILTLDQTEGEGDQSNNRYQTFSNFNLVADHVAYTVQWFGYTGTYGSNVSDKLSSIRTMALNAQDKKDVKTFAADKYNSFQAILYKPNEIYFAVYGQVEQAYAFYELDGTELKTASIDQNKFFNDTYATYLTSPSGEKVFWSEQRDGKDTFFIGDKSGDNPKQVAALQDFQVYGWYSDDYLLVSKKGSELYILPAAGGTELKVTDYHKPVYSYRGYGGGYGGL